MTRTRYAGEHVVVASRKPLRIYPPAFLSHSHPDGGAVLRGETSWRTVNGFCINTRYGHVWVTFRHFRRF